MSSTAENPYILVDGSSYLFRAFHALPPLTTSKGQPTGAIKGVINMIRSLHKQYEGSQVVVVFDAKGKTFRNDLYPEYKANRPPMPDELRSQIKPIHDIITAMGLPLLIIDNVEADDVIGTLAQQATDKGIKVIISTGDKDMAQLVSPHVSLINTMTNVAMDEQGVVDKFGVNPDQIIDYLALMGDKVDNIPGVEKCGPKTAVKWLTEYLSLQGVIDNADKIKGKIGENLRAATEQLPLSYELATIKVDVELPLQLEEYKDSPVEQESLTQLYQEYEFRTLLKEQQSSSTKETSTPAESPATQISIDTSKYDTILTIDSLDSWIAKLSTAELIAFDTETDSLDYMQARLVGMSFAIAPGEAAYLPLLHDYMGAPQQLAFDLVIEKMRPLLENPEIKKVGQNLKYDKSVLANYDIELAGITYDTMLESYVFNSVASRHDMDSLAKNYLGHQTIHFEDVAGKGAKQLTFNQIELEKAAPYAAEDADITLRLHLALWPQLSEHTSLVSVFNEIELPLLNVLSTIERQGVLIDSKQLLQQSVEIDSRLKALKLEAFELAGKEFNLASPKQLQQILFEEQNIPVIKKTPKGAPSTAEDVLQELALDYPLPKVIIEYRGLAKLKSTYTDKLPQMVNPSTGRVHTSYHQAVAATGRLSSTDPNLQNIPIRNEDGRKVRKAFIAPQGDKIVAADYSQIELRIMAHLSEDKGLLDAFAQGKDIHQATAAEVFSVPIENVTADQRRSAKAINFGLIYGMSAFGLSKQLNIARGDAQKYMDLYFQRYPGVLDYMESTRQSASDNGYVETIFGRRLYLPEINSRNGARKKAAERAAINAPMQGTAADIIKKAMLAVQKWITTEQLTDIRMIMQVHDELVFEIKEEKVADYVSKINQIMEQCVALSVPLIVEAGVGDNWEQAH